MTLPLWVLVAVGVALLLVGFAARDFATIVIDLFNPPDNPHNGTP